jgi:selenocysteine-specific elongation factor
VRVRSVQVHDRALPRAEAGQRVAVSLPGTERTELRRGDVLVAPGAFPVSYRLDVALDELEPIGSGERVHVHHGTAEIYGRVVRIGERYAQLRLARPAVAVRGDRLVLRTETTVGGGRVLDPAPPRHASAERLERIDRGEVAATIHAPVSVQSLRHVLEGELDGVERAGEWVFSRAWLEALRADLHARLEAADPLDPGVDTPAEPWAQAIVPLLGLERRGSRLSLRGSGGDLGARSEDAARLARELDAAGFNATKVDDPKLARALEERGDLVRLGDGFAVSSGAYEQARQALVDECAGSGRITLARFRDLLGVGRRTAQLLLERFDSDGLTRRVGDERMLRRAALREQPR